MQPVRSAPLLAVIAVVIAAPPTRVINEIQVYNAEIAPVGTFTLQQDLKYVQNGSRTLRQDQSGVVVQASPLTEVSQRFSAIVPSVGSTRPR